MTTARIVIKPVAPVDSQGTASASAPGDTTVAVTIEHEGMTLSTSTQLQVK